MYKRFPPAGTAYSTLEAQALGRAAGDAAAAGSDTADTAQLPASGWLDWRGRLQVLVEVASALQYLHTRSPPIAHM